MSVEQNLGRFNLYDVFSNFLPGAIYLIGVVLPHPVLISYLSAVSLAGLVIWAIVAFVFGLFFQTIGSGLLGLSAGEKFSERMRVITEEDNDNDEVTAVDVRFVEIVRKEFGLDAEFDNWSRAYKLVLADLETLSHTRAIRLQALFLAMRGITVSVTCIALTAIGYALFQFCTEEFTTTVPFWLLIILILVLCILVVVSYARSLEFRQDMIEYMISEYTLEYRGILDE